MNRKTTVQLRIKSNSEDNPISALFLEMPALAVIKLAVMLLFKKKYKIIEFKKDAVVLERETYECYDRQKASAEIEEISEIIPAEYRQSLRFELMYQQPIENKTIRIGFLEKAC